MTSSISSTAKNSAQLMIQFKQKGTSADDSSTASKLVNSTIKTVENDSNSSDASTLAENLVEKLEESFNSSFDKSSDSLSEDKEKIISNLISFADTDGDKGLSKDELSNLDTSNLSSDEQKVAKNLISNFDDYDTDGDGVLSLDELKDAVPDKAYSAQELGAIKKSMSEDTSKSDSLMNMSNSFAEKLLKNYQKSNPSESDTSIDVEA